MSWKTTCNVSDMSCTFGTNVPVDTTNTPGCGSPTQDEQAALRDALGCRQ